jgi:hypothetical protein
VRVELGWGDNEQGYEWQANARLDGGKIVSIETCFRGRSVLAPTPGMRENPNINALGNKLIATTDTGAQWSCTTFKNTTTLHPQTAALIFEIEGDPNSILPVSEYVFHGEWTDTEKEQAVDAYHVEVKQWNGQFAWISPVFVMA